MNRKEFLILSSVISKQRVRAVELIASTPEHDVNDAMLALAVISNLQDALSDELENTYSSFNRDMFEEACSKIYN